MEYTLKVYETPNGARPLMDWLRELRDSPYAPQGPYGLFESIENQSSESGLYFVQYYPLSDD